MKQHSENAISVSVIGGADGPTSIFVAGTGEKRAKSQDQGQHI